MLHKKKRLFRKKKRPADPFYAEIQKDQIGLYQKYFKGLCAGVDIDNYTLWSKSNKYDREKLKRDSRLIERFCCEEVASHGLSPEYLQTMIHQYVLADPWLRERYQSTWIKTVVYNKEKLTFFPAAQKVRRLLEVVS